MHKHHAQNFDGASTIDAYECRDEGGKDGHVDRSSVLFFYVLGITEEVKCKKVSAVCASVLGEYVSCKSCLILERSASAKLVGKPSESRILQGLTGFQQHS